MISSIASSKAARAGMRLFALCSILALSLPAASALSLAPTALPQAPGPVGHSASGDVAPEEGAQLTDPAGDAKERTPDTIAEQGESFCGVLGAPGRACGLAPAPSDTAADAATPAAPPGFDIISVKFDDTPDDLLVTMRLASLDEATWGGMLKESGQLSFLSVCWGTNESSCDGQAQAYIQPDGKGGARTMFTAGHTTDCLTYCDLSVPADVTFGTPGAITWHVPREILMANASAGEVQPTAVTGEYSDNPHPQTDAFYRVDAGDRTLNGDSAAYLFAVYDYASGGSSYAFRTAASGKHVDLPVQLYPMINGSAAPDPQATIDGYDLIETPSTLTASIRFAPLAPDVSGYRVTAVLGLTDRDHLMAYARLNASGISMVQSGFLSPDLMNATPVDVVVTRTPGSPGYLNFTWNRTDIMSPTRGQLLDSFWLLPVPEDHASETVNGVASVRFSHGTAGAQFLPFASPYRFRYDTASSPNEKITTFTDPAGDAALPTGFTGSAAAFDITSLAVRGTSPTETRITLGIADLHDVAVPNGARAVLYAAGIQTENGAFMVGYYKPATTPVGGASQQYFCSQDEDVLTQIKHDPADAVWTPITGLLTLGLGGPTAGGATPGSISFNVPHSCLGIDKPGPVTVKRVAAGTYLVPSAATPATGAAYEVDHADGGADVTMGAAAHVESVPFWLAPFGIDQFWNIAGVATALGGGLIAIGARQRRRNALARQMRAIDAAHQKHRESAPEWKAAMAEIRARAGELLRRGKLRPDEVLVIERRIDLLAADIIAPPVTLPEVSVGVGALLLDRYRLERKLGEGGQGAAWLAEDQTIGRKVVVKTLVTGGLSAGARRLALAEARLAGGIDHRNVVRVLDVREVGDQAFLILEYVEGGTLRGLLARKGALPADEALRIYRDIMSGLAAAHERGIVHRDVKPENVLLARDGTAKLADFGAARDMRPGATIVPAAAGTLAYMSPEQARGNAADARSDLYSAAAVLVEMLTGELYLPLRQADEFEARALILERAPELHLPDRALVLTGLIVRSLAKKPSDRYQNVEETLAALDGAIGA